MAGVKEVRQLDDTHLHWRVEVAGKDREWDSEITEQEPDERIRGVASAAQQRPARCALSRRVESHARAIGHELRA